MWSLFKLQHKVFIRFTVFNDTSNMFNWSVWLYEMLLLLIQKVNIIVLKSWSGNKAGDEGESDEAAWMETGRYDFSIQAQVNLTETSPGFHHVVFPCTAIPPLPCLGALDAVSLSPYESWIESTGVQNMFLQTCLSET